MTATLDQFDYKLELIDTTKGEYVIDDKSSPPFDPTATYYLVLFQRNCPSARATVKAVGEVPVPVADAGPDAQPDVKEAGPLADAQPEGGEPVAPAAEGSVEGGTCGCSAVGRTSGSMLAGIMLSLAALAGARSRRRRTD